MKEFLEKAETIAIIPKYKGENIYQITLEIKSGDEYVEHTFMTKGMSSGSITPKFVYLKS